MADNPEDIAQALVSLLNAPERAALMGEKAREYVTAHFDWQACARQLEGAYEALSGSPAKEAACA